MDSRSGFERLRGAVFAGMVGAGAVVAPQVQATSRRDLPINLSYSATLGGAFLLTNTSISGFLPIYTWWGWRVGDGQVLSTISNAALPRVDSEFLLGESASEDIFAVQMGYLYYQIGSDGTTYSTTYFDPAALDGILALKVGGKPFVNPTLRVDTKPFSDTGDWRVSSLQNEDTGVPGIVAQVRYYFFGYEPTVRAIYSFENNTDTDITTSATIVGDLFQVSANSIFEAADSLSPTGQNTLVEAEDYWYTVSDASLPPTASSFGAPYTTLLRYGENAQVVPTDLGETFSGATPDTFQWHYELTIPAGETRYIMAFAGLAQYQDASQLAAFDLFGVSLPTAKDFSDRIGSGSMAALEAAGLLVNLSDTVKENIVNFYLDSDNNGIQDRDEPDFVYTPEVVESNVSVFSGQGGTAGAFSVKGALSALAFLLVSAIARARRPVRGAKKNF